MQQHSDPEDSFEDSSADEADEPKLPKLPFKEGVLSKWTNYMNGWQDRFVNFSDGKLEYYRSQVDSKYCRGRIDVASESAVFSVHDTDARRFEIRYQDDIMYFRANTREDRDAWLSALHHAQALVGPGGGGSLKRSGSLGSLVSIQSAASMGSNSTRTLSDKLMEVKTLHALASEQFSNVWRRCGLVSDKPAAASTPTPTPAPAPASTPGAGDSDTESELRTELIACKACASGVMDSVQELVDIVQRREETWKKRLAKVTEKRRRLETLYKNAKKNPATSQDTNIDNPDMFEGPSSLLTEEQWFDALENTLDAQNSHEAEDAADAGGGQGAGAANVPAHGEAGGKKEKSQEASVNEAHAAWVGLCDKQVQLALEVFQTGGGIIWDLINDSDDVKVYRRAEATEEGKVVEFVRTEATFVGVSSKEICSYFTDIRHRMEWEQMVAQCRTVERIDPSTSISYAVYKAQWPTQQRALLNIAHCRALEGGNDRWIAVTHSVEHPNVSDASRIQITGKSAIIADTTYLHGYKDGEGNTPRGNVKTRINYYCEVDPGGWAPKAIVKAVAINEFPKIVRELRKHSTLRFKGLAIDK